MRFLVRIFEHEGDFSAMAPDLPGCVAAGDSVDEVRRLMAEAIRLHIEMMRRSGQKVPTPVRVVDLHVDQLEEGELCTWVEVKSNRETRSRKALNQS